MLSQDLGIDVKVIGAIWQAGKGKLNSLNHRCIGGTDLAEECWELVTETTLIIDFERLFFVFSNIRKEPIR